MQNKIGQDFVWDGKGQKSQKGKGNKMAPFKIIYI